jgi:hypothetical protein
MKKKLDVLEKIEVELNSYIYWPRARHEADPSTMRK